MGYSEAAERYAVYSEPSPFDMTKEYTLHDANSARPARLTLLKNADRHLLFLEDAYVMFKVGVFTKEGKWLPSLYTSKTNTTRGSIRKSRLKFTDFWWKELSRSRAAISRKPNYYADSSYSGYGHFLLEALPRCWGLPHANTSGLHILSGAKKRRALLGKCLPALGLPPSRLKAYDELIFCKKLYVATQPAFIGQYVYPEARDVWDKVGAYYANRGRKEATPKKVYVSRSGASRRVLKNQAVIEEFFARNGYFICRPETMKFTDQVHLFANASHIVGPYGSGLFNALFAQNPVSMFIFSPSVDFMHHLACYDHKFTVDVYVEGGEQADGKKSQGDYFADWELQDLTRFFEVAGDWISRSQQQ